MKQSKFLTYTSIADADSPPYTRLLFGNPHSRVMSSGEEHLAFVAGSVFGLERVLATPYQQRWQIMVCEATLPGRLATRLSGVKPGAALVLMVDYEKSCTQFLRLVRTWQSARIDPANIPASYYHYLHGRLDAGLPFRPYRRD